MRVIEVTGQEREEAFQIRKEVFAEEQGVPLQDEFDSYDQPDSPARHIIVYYQDQAAATGRVRWLGDTAKLERICVRPSMRKFGLGSVVVKSLEKIAQEEGFRKGKVHAQTQARDFYLKLGYTQVSEEFMEDGIPHIIMEKKFPVFFPYGAKEIEYLKAQDKVLGEAIESIGKIEREVIPDLFEALLSSIVSQQISKKAAQTVWNRLLGLLGEIKPERIADVELSAIQGCGMSMRKAGYIKGIAQAALEGQIDFQKLPTLSDEEIIKSLSSLPGVGVWTAEMMLIFSLCRPDVVSYRDLAIRRGMMNCYGLSELSPETFMQYRHKYSPYGSVASLYLWALS